MDYVLVPEYISAIFIAVYIANSLLDNKVSSLQDVLFRLSLYATITSIFFSVTTSYTAMHTLEVSHAVNVAMNSAYFAFTFLMCSTIALSGLSYMFEGHTDSVRFRNFFIAILALFTLSLAAVFINLKTGWLFTVNAQSDYIRGPYNTMTYWLLLANVVVIAAAYGVERTRIRHTFKRIIITLPLVSSVMAIYQVIFRNTLLTGSIATLVLTTLLIYGQQQRVHVDHLTALPGREMFYRTLEQFSKRSRIFYVIFVSLREYKTINNRFGQLGGDDFLRAVAQYLAVLDKRAVACRYSGVEFALILPNFSEDEYVNFFDKLCARFDEPWTVDGNTAKLSASIVDITYPEHAKTVNELISSLEYAIRLSKINRRGSVVHFDNRLRSTAGRFRYILSQMTTAPDDRFFIALQPVHECTSGLPRGAEVLVRLLDENGRTVMPGEFIPLAEETGYVSDIDWFVMDKACRFLSEHRNCGIEWLSVNLTPLMHGETVIEQITALLTKYDLSPSMLKVEVTERLFSSDVASLNATMQGLLALGVGVYLDDFGTGYSNLYSTSKLPLECVKIDRVFVSEIENDLRSHEFLRTLIDVLHGMGSSVTVEGVETVAQRDIVRSLGADMIQGYYYSKPMSPEEFLAYMRWNLE